MAVLVTMKHKDWKLSQIIGRLAYCMLLTGCTYFTIGPTEKFAFRIEKQSGQAVRYWTIFDDGKKLDSSTGNCRTTLANIPLGKKVVGVIVLLPNGKTQKLSVPEQDGEAGGHISNYETQKLEVISNNWTLSLLYAFNRVYVFRDRSNGKVCF